MAEEEKKDKAEETEPPRTIVIPREVLEDLPKIDIPETVKKGKLKPVILGPPPEYPPPLPKPKPVILGPPPKPKWESDDDE